MKYPNNVSLKLVVLLLSLLFFTTCSNKQPAAENKPLVEKQAPAEKLLGLHFNYDKNEVVLTVVTTGCTAKTDLSFSVSGNTIIITRNKRDECKAMPEAVSFTYSLKEAGIEVNKAYTVLNSFITNPNLSQ
ncbi:MAG: hypothetical protein ABL876_13315 [Chitinophagaceae bacterium]